MGNMTTNGDETNTRTKRAKEFAQLDFFISYHQKHYSGQTTSGPNAVDSDGTKVL